MELHSFDAEYLRRLLAGDPQTEQHFTSYFGQLLLIKLRSRAFSRQVIDDVRQETFVRVIAILKDKGIRQPESLGAFVNSVCNNVLLEFHRASTRYDAMPENAPEPADRKVDLERDLQSSEAQKHVREILATLPARDRDLLRAVFLDEADKDRVCEQYEVTRDYLRVLLHRAKQQFRASYERSRFTTH